MSTEPVARPQGTWGLRLLVLVPIVLLVGIAATFVQSGGSITGLVGSSPPPADTFEVRRVQFHPGEIQVLVRNPQPEDLTIAVVTVDDAIVPFTLDGGATLGRLRSRTITIPYTWVEDDPYLIGVTSSSGIQTTHEVPAAVETPGASGRSAAGYALIGLLVGVVPVALGMLWLPSLRRADPRWVAAFMALTGGLLTFLAVDALAEALELQSALPGALGGPGLVRLGVALSAGAPAILGAWIGGFVTNEILAVLFFAIAVGAALQVVMEVGRYIARRAPGGLGSGWVVGGFLAGIVIMYLTGLIAG